jgi:hypothetical protein
MSSQNKTNISPQENYENYVVSKKHGYTSSLMSPSEFNIYLPKWEQGLAMWHRCSNTDIAEQWDMKPVEVKGEGCFGPNGDIYSLWILGYIPLSLHKLRMQDEHLASGWTRWWCRLEYKYAWYWRPLWGKLTEQRTRVMKELITKYSKFEIYLPLMLL